MQIKKQYSNLMQCLYTFSPKIMVAVEILETEVMMLQKNMRNPKVAVAFL
jgi:hypothetical protein